MATTIDYERAAGRGGSSARQVMVAAGDRTGAFRAARRHSRVVRVLRVGLPLSAVLISGFYVISVMEAAGWGANLPQLVVPRIMPENLAMRNPRYEGFNKDGGAYVVTAKTATQVLTNFNLIKLETITGDFTDAQKSVTHLDATRGTFDSKANRLELFDGISINGDNGLKAKLSKATVMTKEGTVTSKVPVEVEMPAGTIRANQMTYRNQSRELTFVDNVETHLKARGKPAAETADQQDTEDAAKKLFGSSNAPVDIKSSRLDIDDAKKIATFTGNVRAVQENATVTSPELVVTYESAQPEDGAPKLDGNGSVKHILAKGPVVIDQAPNDHVTADQAEFDPVNEKAMLTGNVVMTSGTDRRATADAAEIDQRADTIVLTGNVVVNQGRNELRGDKLFVDRKTNRTLLTADGGHINARFFQNDTAGAKHSASSQVTETGALGLATFKADPNAPIDIEARQLDVNDAAKTAVFSGDVSAEQGEITITAAQLTAFYSGQAGAGGLGSTGDAKGPAAQLTKIEARRKVVITSKKGQKATGDWAEFNPKKNRATVGGDVVLTEGKNVVRGSRLDIDTVTGQSTIHASADAVSASEPARSGAEAASAANSKMTARKRPSAIFYPKKANGAGKSKSATSNWGATTESPSNGGN
jgi:lipopolysaccharide transport protein LptA/LPS export ABC transporter protein LptC